MATKLTYKVELTVPDEYAERLQPMFEEHVTKTVRDLLVEQPDFDSINVEITEELMKVSAGK